MTEQVEVIAESGIPAPSHQRAHSDEVRASLEAVRVAQENARRRARRETLQARVWFIVVVVVVGGGIAGLRFHRAHDRRPQTAASSQVAPVLQQPAAAPVNEAVSSKAAVPAPAPAAQQATEAPSAVQPTVAPVMAAEGCDSASIQTAPWRLSPEACTRAFQADPKNASLALAVAHAEHAHGHFAEAAQWARRAIDLDPNMAEAYVIIARAEAENGHRERARKAYRSYLKLAPRGWHHTEARSALRAATS